MTAVAFRRPEPALAATRPWRIDASLDARRVPQRRLSTYTHFRSRAFAPHPQGLQLEYYRLLAFCDPCQSEMRPPTHHGAVGVDVDFNICWHRRSRACDGSALFALSCQDALMSFRQHSIWRNLLCHLRVAATEYHCRAFHRRAWPQTVLQHQLPQSSNAVC